MPQGAVALPLTDFVGKISRICDAETVVLQGTIGYIWHRKINAINDPRITDSRLFVHRTLNAALFSAAEKRGEARIPLLAGLLQSTRPLFCAALILLVKSGLRPF
jgi:hypothetical protein